MSEITIDYVKTDAECVELHRFLYVVAQAAVLAPIDLDDSMAEVVRIRDQGVSLVARCDGEIVGALGLTAASWWFNSHVSFFTDRWFFVYPMFANLGVGARLLGEAAAIADSAQMDIIINGKLKHRAKSVGRGIHFTTPTVITPDQGKPEASLH